MVGTAGEGNNPGGASGCLDDAGKTDTCHRGSGGNGYN